MILVCYETKDAKGWEELPNGTDMDVYMGDHPDRIPTHVFKSGPEYQIDTIEQARFNAMCHAFGFRPEHYRRVAVEPNERVMELYGFDTEHMLCLFRNISTGQTRALHERQAHSILKIG